MLALGKLVENLGESITGGLGLKAAVEVLLGIHGGLQACKSTIVSHGPAEYGRHCEVV